MSATNRDHNRGGQPVLEHCDARKSKKSRPHPVSGQDLLGRSVTCSVRAEKDRARSIAAGG